jgi:hypothetical protein
MMSDGPLPWVGGCRCGQVRIKITKAPLLTMACHCAGCQKMTASAFSLGAVIPADGFEVTSGEPVVGGLHGPNRHFHCGFCMSWVFTRPEGIDWFVNVRSTMLDGGEATTPFVETMTREKLPWVTTPAAFSFEGFPEAHEYDLPVKAYQERSSL